MKGLPRNERRRAAAGTPTPPPVAVSAQAPEGPPRRTAALPAAWKYIPIGLGARGARRAASRAPALPARTAAETSAERRQPARTHGAAWTLLLLAAAAAIVLVIARGLEGTPPIAVAAWRSMASFSRALAAPRLGSQGAPDTAALFAPREAPPAPPKVEHEGYASIPGGVLFTPASFAPGGSSYDLLIHFHGNTQVVRESAEVAGLNAAVAVVNLGVGSGPYEEAYAGPGTYEALLDEINRGVAQRGVPWPRLRRVALSSWSAGYGAIGKILDTRRGADPLDALLVLDGIHTGWLEGARARDVNALNPLHLAPFASAARKAAAGAFLFSITHAEIDPITYAGTALTADYLLQAAAGGPLSRAAARKAPPHLALRSAEGAVSKRLEKRMVPTTEARVGDLQVRGFRGNTPEHHMAHLLQMGATVLPELAARWRGQAP